MLNELKQGAIKLDQDLRFLNHEIMEGGAAFQEVFRMSAGFIRAMSIMTARWGDFHFDPKMSVGRQVKHGLVASLMVNSWMSLAGVDERSLNPASLGVCSKYEEYVSAVDDLLDGSSKGNKRPTFTQDPGARRLRKELFSLISELPNEKEVKGIIYKSGHSLARAELESKEEGATDLKSAIRLRDETSGETIRSAVAILNAIHNVPKETAGAAERSLLNFGVALQLSDDMADFAEDRRKGISENLLFQILRQHPGELEKVDGFLAKSANISSKQFGKLAPESLKFARGLQTWFFDKIPDRPACRTAELAFRMKYRL